MHKLKIYDIYLIYNRLYLQISGYLYTLKYAPFFTNSAKIVTSRPRVLNIIRGHRYKNVG